MFVQLGIPTDGIIHGGKGEGVKRKTRIDDRSLPLLLVLVLPIDSPFLSILRHRAEEEEGGREEAHFQFFGVGEKEGFYAGPLLQEENGAVSPLPPKWAWRVREGRTEFLPFLPSRWMD